MSDIVEKFRYKYRDYPKSCLENKIIGEIEKLRKQHAISVQHHLDRTKLTDRVLTERDYYIAENKKLVNAINMAMDVYTDGRPDPERRMYDILGPFCTDD
jgi:hypothetical protein